MKKDTAPVIIRGSDGLSDLWAGQGTAVCLGVVDE